MDTKHTGVASTSVELQDYADDGAGGAAKGGTANDAADMMRMGKVQELRRDSDGVKSLRDYRVGRSNEAASTHRKDAYPDDLGADVEAQRFFSIVGFVTIMQGTWELTLVANWFGLYDGGTAGIIWMTIIVWLCMIATVACMAEMASMAPTAGGQQASLFHRTSKPRLLTLRAARAISLVCHLLGRLCRQANLARVSEFAPEALQKPLSFIVGWSAFLAWVAGIPACAQIMVSMVQGMALLRNPDASITALWQATLLIFLFLILTFSFKYPPGQISARDRKHHGFLAFIVILWAMVDHPPAERVFTDFYDGGGWGNLGLATLVGIGSPLWCFVGPDAGAHMSEELKDASLQLPRGMMWATFFNGVMGVRTYLLRRQGLGVLVEADQIISNDDHILVGPAF
ncbi:hypothetical protein LTR53_013875 [Teratosphaeriaceae sp. CCFEE 6253]|nr:hypothetical protein LTR53_013875 [Teratosphaeriaceae sp. CCFEE 6253]